MEIETFEIRSKRPSRRSGRFHPLLELRQGSHVHYNDVTSSVIRSSINHLNHIGRQKSPTFHLTVHVVDETDKKGPGFRVLRNDREVQS